MCLLRSILMAISLPLRDVLMASIALALALAVALASYRLRAGNQRGATHPGCDCIFNPISLATPLRGLQVQRTLPFGPFARRILN